MPTFEWNLPTPTHRPLPPRFPDPEIPVVGSIVRVSQVVDPGDRPHLGKVFVVLAWDPRTLFVVGATVSGDEPVQVHPEAIHLEAMKS